MESEYCCSKEMHPRAKEWPSNGSWGLLEIITPVINQDSMSDAPTAGQLINVIPAEFE
jgi:hypothetical protein